MAKLTSEYNKSTERTPPSSPDEEAAIPFRPFTFSHEEKVYLEDKLRTIKEARDDLSLKNNQLQLQLGQAYIEMQDGLQQDLDDAKKKIEDQNPRLQQLQHLTPIYDAQRLYSLNQPLSLGSQNAYQKKTLEFAMDPTGSDYEAAANLQPNAAVQVTDEQTCKTTRHLSIQSMGQSSVPKESALSQQPLIKEKDGSLKIGWYQKGKSKRLKTMRGEAAKEGG